MKILLVNTNKMKPAVAPIGLDYLADNLIAAGHKSHLLDLCFSTDTSSDIRSAVQACSPDVIGLSVRNTDECYFCGGAFFLPGIKDMVNEFRRITDAPIVMGGVGFSVMPGPVMGFCGADYGISGEGEDAFIKLLTALVNRTGLEAVPGLLYRDGGGIMHNPPSFVDLDTLPRTRSFIDNARYYTLGGQAGFETKRGCNMACVYCADPVSKGRSVRLRSPRLVVDELKALLAQGIDHFHTCDCEFNVPGEHAKAVCREIINTGLGEKIRWYAYCSILPFDSEMADLFKRAGCAGVDFGADSGSDEMLRRLERHFASDDLMETARLCHQFGIPFMYDLLIGSPGDTRTTVKQTIELMRKIDADCVGISMGVRIYEGTKMAEWVRSQGDLSQNPDLYRSKEDNLSFLKPVFYVSPDLGDGMISYLHELVGGDKRFFLPSDADENANYNYNDNNVLVDAIANGARGAYWDILRRMQ